MKLVTFNEGRVGRIRDGKTIEELDVPSMREYFEGGESAKPTGKTFLLDDVRLRAPIVPKKFFHTAGNYQEHHEESLRVGWSHPVRPWIVFFQNVDAIIGPGDEIVYPEHLTSELDYELELAVIIKKAGKFFTAEEAHEYIGGFIVFNDITARDIQRREMRSGVFSFCKAIETFVPIGPWIVTPDEIPDPHNLNVELRVNGEKRQSSNTSHMSYSIEEIIAHYSPLGYSAGDILSTGTVSGVAGFSPDAASLYMKPGDVVEIKDSSKQAVTVLEAVGLAERDVPEYYEVDHSKMTAKLTRVPHATEVPYPVHMEPNLVIEYYSR